MSKAPTVQYLLTAAQHQHHQNCIHLTHIHLTHHQHSRVLDSTEINRLIKEQRFGGSPTECEKKTTRHN